MEEYSSYDPHIAPAPAGWLELDEDERSYLIEQYHEAAGIPLPNARLHATLHTIVENQIALELPAGWCEDNEI